MRYNTSMDFEEKKKEIGNIARAFDLDIVILFGSFAKGRAHAGSDLDIGVYRKTPVSFDEEIALSAEFAEVFKRNDVDVVVISSRTPLLMSSILHTGKILFEKDPLQTLSLKVYAWKLAAEQAPFRDRSYLSLKNRILHGNAKPAY